MKVTVTPPHDGPGVLLVESDHLLYTKNIDAKAGATFEIPVTKDWERHDVYVVAMVFRGGEADEHTTPARAMGIEYVAMDRNDRRIPLKLAAPAMMRPGNPLDVTVQADAAWPASTRSSRCRRWTRACSTSPTTRCPTRGPGCSPSARSASTPMTCTAASSRRWTASRPSCATAAT